jgi:hypothetical protein
MHGRADHVVLLGDSIFDNGAYVPGHPDVVAQLQSQLPPGARATLLAVDGAITTDVSRQLTRLPGDATQLVASAGGNDALGEAHLLGQPCKTVADGVALLGEAQRRFASKYADMVDAVLARGVPTALCTIYDANFPPPDGEIITAALSLFNDAITRSAFSRGLPLIDLRLMFNDRADYANPIEPSARGGEKIARAIAALASGTTGRSSVVVIEG